MEASKEVHKWALNHPNSRVSEILTNAFPVKVKVNISETISRLEAIGKKEEIDLVKLIDFFKSYDGMYISIEPEREKCVLSETEIKAILRKTEGGKRGYIVLKKPLSWDESVGISKGIYEKSGKMFICLSMEKRLVGKITQYIGNKPYKLPLISEVKEKDTKADRVVKDIVFFNKGIDNRKVLVLDSYSTNVYLYKFISDTNNEYLLISLEELDTDNEEIVGMEVNMSDTITIGESKRLATTLPTLMTKRLPLTREVTHHTSDPFRRGNLPEGSITPEIIEKNVLVIRNTIFNIFTHPDVFEKLIISWMFSSSYKYPPHLFILGKGGFGKSQMINNIFKSTSTENRVWDGSECTFNSLLPTFGTIPVNEGYCYKTRMFAFMDEFLRAFTRTKRDKDRKIEELGRLNNYLEHQKDREAMSGVGHVMLQPTSRALVVTNPIMGVGDLYGLIDRTDEAFMSRWLVYFATPMHIQMINQQKEKIADKERKKFGEDEVIQPREFRKLLKWLQSFKISGVDDTRLIGIKNKLKAQIRSSDIQTHIDMRFLHHIRCVLDGLVKYRCLTEMVQEESEFKPIDLDYDNLFDLLSVVVSSWEFGAEKIMTLPVNVREHYLDEKSQLIFQLVNDSVKSTEDELKELALRNKITDGKNFLSYLNTLKQYDLIWVDKEGLIHPHWYKKGEQIRIDTIPTYKVGEKKRNLLHEVENIIIDLLADPEKNEVFYEDIIIEAKKKMIDEGKINGILIELKKKSVIIEKSKNCFIMV